MRELERRNPVRPSLAAKPLKSDRLTAAIESGVPIWIARKQEKARLRAQEHRARVGAEAAKARAERPPGEDPEPTAEALDERMKEAARQELREFRALLSQEGTRQAKRPPDSSRRRKLKKKQRKERLRERARNDDAARDTNHAIAHAHSRSKQEQNPREPEGRFDPGLPEASALALPPRRDVRQQERHLGETGLVEGVTLGVVVCLWAQFCWKRVRCCCRRGRRTDTNSNNFNRPPSFEGAPPPKAPPPPLRMVADRSASSSQTRDAPLASPTVLGQPAAPNQLRGVAKAPPPPPPEAPIERLQRRRVGNTTVVCTPRGTSYHRPSCPHVSGHETRPCTACTPTTFIPAPTAKPYGGRAEVKFLSDDATFHSPSCVLVRPLHKSAQPCRDCGPETRWEYAPELGPRNRDDAERDTNHAVAHLWLLVCVMFLAAGLLSGCVWGAQGDPSDPVLPQGSEGSEECFIPGPPPPSQEEGEGPSAKRCGAKPRRKVEFREEGDPPSFEVLSGPVKGQREPPFLGGPSTARRLYGTKTPQLALPLASREAFESEALRVAMDRLTLTTQKAYQGQLRWWRLFCCRRQVPWLLSGKEPSEEETLLLDFLLHTAINGARAPGTLKMRLAAIKSAHMSLGLRDPLEGKPRLLLVLAGFKKRYATPTRRLPVTPVMLSYLFVQLWETAPREAPNLWLALCLGYFFLLRASEFLPVPYLPDSRHLKGEDLRLRREGRDCTSADFASADEVVITLRGSKTDRFNKGTTRNHFRGSPPLCPVDAAIKFFSTFPTRYWGGEESEEPLLKGVTRECIQMLIAKAAEQQGMRGATGAHSLRFGGASAIWAAYQNSAQLQRFGRWASDIYHGYTWDARASSQGVAKAMAEVDLIPP
ncbi:unnamed protein product [Symbiodinium sp. CCMP2592]|nr:unnamed protein product [Symbiodinium sp. CCMP2592]